MNQEKAREFFSAYFEGVLEPGLKQSFEARLAADAMLQADYAAFSETMGELRTMPEEEIEAPIFLSDRVATRLDEVFVKGSPRGIFGSWQTWPKAIGFAALA